MTIDKFCEIRKEIINEGSVELATSVCEKIMWLLNACKCYCFQVPLSNKKSLICLDSLRYMNEGTMDVNDF